MVRHSLWRLFVFVFALDCFTKMPKPQSRQDIGHIGCDALLVQPHVGGRGLIAYQHMYSMVIPDPVGSIA